MWRANYTQFTNTPTLITQQVAKSFKINQNLLWTFLTAYNYSNVVKTRQQSLIDDELAHPEVIANRRAVPLTTSKQTEAADLRIGARHSSADRERL